MSDFNECMLKRKLLLFDIIFFLLYVPVYHYLRTWFRERFSLTYVNGMSTTVFISVLYNKQAPLL